MDSYFFLLIACLSCMSIDAYKTVIYSLLKIRNTLFKRYSKMKEISPLKKTIKFFL